MGRRARVAAAVCATGAAVACAGCHVVANLEELQPETATPQGVAVGWVTQLGDGSTQLATALAVDENDDIVVALSFDGTLAVGSESLTNSGDEDAAVVKLAPDGSVRWAKSVSDPDGIKVIALATGPSSEIALGGQFEGTFQIGETQYTSQQFLDAFVIVLDAAGEPRWARTFGAGGIQNVRALAIAPSADVLAVGQYAGTPVMFPGGETFGLDSTGGADGFFLRFSDVGGLEQVRGFGGPGYQRAAALARDDDGAIYVAGTFDDTIQLDSDTALHSHGGTDLFIAKLDSHLGVVYGSALGDGIPTCGCEVELAVGSDRRLFATSSFYGTVDFGATALAAPFLDADTFLARFDAYGDQGGLKTMWAQSFDDMPDESDAYTPERPYGLALGPDGGVVVAGVFGGHVDFGGGGFVNADGAKDVFVAAFDADGRHRWSMPIAITTPVVDADEPYSPRVAVDRHGDVIVAGWFRGVLDVGAQRFEAAGGADDADAFVVKIVTPKP